MFVSFHVAFSYASLLVGEEIHGRMPTHLVRRGLALPVLQGVLLVIHLVPRNVQVQHAALVLEGEPPRLWVAPLMTVDWISKISAVPGEVAARDVKRRGGEGPRFRSTLFRCCPPVHRSRMPVCLQICYGLVSNSELRAGLIQFDTAFSRSHSEMSVETLHSDVTDKESGLKGSIPRLARPKQPCFSRYLDGSYL